MADPRVLAAVSEAEWQAQVLRMAHRSGWRTHHEHDSRRGSAGVPDLLLVRERVLWVELKTEKGRLRPEQALWIAALEGAGQTVCIWRPSDLADVETVLR